MDMVITKQKSKQSHDMQGTMVYRLIWLRSDQHNSLAFPPCSLHLEVPAALRAEQSRRCVIVLDVRVTTALAAVGEDEPNRALSRASKRRVWQDIQAGQVSRADQ